MTTMTKAQQAERIRILKNENSRLYDEINRLENSLNTYKYIVSKYKEYHEDEKIRKAIETAERNTRKTLSKNGGLVLSLNNNYHKEKIQKISNE